MLIYNFHTNFTALVKSAYEQCYLFYESTDYKQIGNAPSNDPNNACVGTAINSVVAAATVVISLFVAIY